MCICVCVCVYVFVYRRRKIHSVTGQSRPFHETRAITLAHAHTHAKPPRRAKNRAGKVP